MKSAFSLCEVRLLLNSLPIWLKEGIVLLDDASCGNLPIGYGLLLDPLAVLALVLVLNYIVGKRLA